MNREMLKSKTFWAGVMSIVGAVGGAATGTLPVAFAVQTSITALLAIFIRDGIASK